MFSLHWVSLLIVLSDQLLESLHFFLVSLQQTYCSLLHSLFTSSFFIKTNIYIPKISHHLSTGRLNSNVCTYVPRLIWRLKLERCMSPRSKKTEEDCRSYTRLTCIFWVTVLPSIMETGLVEWGKISPPPPLPLWPLRGRPRHVL